MIRHILAAGISAAALAAALPAQAQEAEPTYPTMTYGEWGVDLDMVDTSVDPGADFDAYVNGLWKANATVPSDRSRFGAFDLLDEEATADVENLMRELVASDPAPGTSARRIVDAYQAFMDTDAIEAAGLAPLYPYLTDIYSAPDLASLARLWGSAGYPSLVAAGVAVDRRDPNSYIVSVGFDGMGLPDRDYYLVDSERNLEIRAAYMDYLEFMLEQAGYADPETAARLVYAFEHRVAELEWDTAMLRNPRLTYNILSRDELQSLSPQFPIDALLDASEFGEVARFQASQLPPTEEEIEELGLTAEQLGMMGGGLPAMMELLEETPLANIKAYMAVRLLQAQAPVLPSAIDQANFAFYSGVLSGQEEQQPRWKRAIAAVENQLGEQLGALYVERHFPPDAKARMDELVANLRLAMASDIEANAWMTAETTAEAMAKLDAFTPMIGYPEEFETYDGLQIRREDPVGNRVRATQWALDDIRAKLGGPVDKTEWSMLPQTVNAYYSPVFNQIVFPAAILQAPFFNAEADPAVNYGGIGAVIGHEIGHGFDDQGSQYDGTGTLRNWWQDTDREGFMEEAGKLARLIEAYCIEEGEVCLNPGQSMGETLGDVVGLQMAYRAYRLSLEGEEAPVIDGLTGDQRFLLGFAQIWRQIMRPEALRSQVISANHPPADFRINNTVRHLDAWYDAFGVTEDDPLYLAPEDRVSIW